MFHIGATTSANILLSARHFSKCFTCDNLFNPCNNPMKWSYCDSHLSNEETEVLRGQIIFKGDKA